MKRWNITSRDGQADITIVQRRTSNKTEARPTTEAPLHETKAKAMKSIMVEMHKDMETLNVRGVQAGTAMLMGMIIVLATRTVAVEVEAEVVVTIEVERDVVGGVGVMVVAAAED